MPKFSQSLELPPLKLTAPAKEGNVLFRPYQKRKAFSEVLLSVQTPASLSVRVGPSSPACQEPLAGAKEVPGAPVIRRGRLLPESFSRREATPSPPSPRERAREVLARLEEEVVVRTRRFRRENPEMFDFAEATPTSSQQSRGSDVASDASQWSYSQRSVSEVLPLDELIKEMLKQRGTLTEFLRSQLAGDLADLELLHRAVRELLKNDPERLAQTVREYLKRAERVREVAESLSRCAMEEGEYERGILGEDLP